MQSGTFSFRDLWALRPGVAYLNHGSFGPSPRSVIAARQEWIERLECEPMDFFVRQMEGHLESARARLSEVVGTNAKNLVFVDNATFAMNIVAMSFPLAGDDEVLATNHEYGAVLRIWRERCHQARAKLVVQKLPESFASAEHVVESLFAGVTDRTRLIVVSQITSPTALILPVEEICRRARERGVRVCIDGPHAVAAIPVAIDQLDCDFYCASCHKWLSAPFGSGFLFVHPRWQQTVRPAVVSWGNSLGGRPPTWHDEFVWSGTRDPSPFLAVPEAIDFLAKLSPGPETSIWASRTDPPSPNARKVPAGEQTWLRRGVHGVEGVGLFRQLSAELLEEARQRIIDVTGLDPIGVGPNWYGTMMAFPLPSSIAAPPEGHMHPFQSALWERFQIEVPIVNWNGRRFLRVSCHLYNDSSDIDRLVSALRTLLV
jgi:isopenicillin-N epimerase